MESILLYLSGTPNMGILGYIDPGTGSIILQAIIGAVVGAAIAVKLFWHRILKFLGIRKGKTTNFTEEEGGGKK